MLVLGAGLMGRRLIPSLGLLWINLLTDTLPGRALALEPGDQSVLHRPPSAPGSPLLDRQDWRGVVRDGAVLAGVAATAAIVGGPVAAFATIGAVQFGFATMCRAPEPRIGGRFIALTGGSAALHLLATASAPMRSLLRIPGAPGPALACFGISFCAPLFLAWRKHAHYEIARRGPASNKETST
jgi:Ca2+-transporting ATPase